LIPPTVAELDGVPLEQALPMSVAIPASNSLHKVYVFIDNIILVVLDHDNGCKCGRAAALLAIDTACRPVSRCEPVPQNEITGEKKLLTESLLEEVVGLAHPHPTPLD
jgi:hypothetical protein